MYITGKFVYIYIYIYIYIYRYVLKTRHLLLHKLYFNFSYISVK